MMEKHDVVLLHDIVLTMLLHFVTSPDLLLVSMSYLIFYLTNFSTDKLGFEVRMNLASSLRRSGTFLYEPRGHLDLSSCVKLLKIKHVAAKLQ